MPSYYPVDMMAAAAIEAEAALQRVAARMARQTLSNMLHLDPAAAHPFGGEERLRQRLEASYRESLSADT